MIVLRKGFIFDLSNTQNKAMTTININLEKKIKATFLAEFGYEILEMKIEGNYVYAENYYLRIANNKITKTFGRAWFIDN